MNEALSLAERGRGRVEPNPMVGAVLVHGGRVVARGWHERFGGAHAEVRALEDPALRGLGGGRGGPAPQLRSGELAEMTMVVTLEPCCHTGKTGPCTEAILEAGIRKVIVAMVDPNPAVAGKGIAQLRDAGVEVTVGVSEQRARQLNEPFIKRVTTGWPWVIAKWAQTLDGKIATATGDSQWISNPDSRRRVHAVRGRVDAIVVGVGTVLADDPSLTARDTEVHRVARRVVIDRDLRTPQDAKVTFCDAAPTTIVTTRAAMQRESDKVAAWQERGVALFEIAGPQRKAGRVTMRLLELDSVFEHLVQAHDATNVLVEGGAGLLGSLFDQGLVDQVLAFIAPKVVGDAAALGALSGLTCDTIAAARGLTLRDVTRLGDDVLLDYRVPGTT